MRLKDRIAIVVGAGQSPGEGMGNGRATALTFAREGARVLCVDHHPDSAKETADMIAAKGGTALAVRRAQGSDDLVPCQLQQRLGLVDQLDLLRRAVL